MPKAKPEKVPVTIRALLQRINRKLAAMEGSRGRQLRATRGTTHRENLGDYYLLTQAGVLTKRVDPEKLGRELEVLKEWERLEQ
jgi:hypothetical protein